ATHGILPRLPVAVIRDEQIEAAVAVVVNPTGPDRPQWPAPRNQLVQPRRLCHICKGAIAVVAIEVVRMNTGNEKIFVAVVVVITHCHTDAVAFALQPCFGGYITECAIAVVSIKAVPELRAGLLQRWQRRA